MNLNNMKQLDNLIGKLILVLLSVSLAGCQHYGDDQSSGKTKYNLDSLENIKRSFTFKEIRYIRFEIRNYPILPFKAL